MAAEFYILFKDRDWYARNRHKVEEQICRLSTFTTQEDKEFRLLGKELRNQEDRWSYDVRLFTQNPEYILMEEISAHPNSVETDLSSFLAWLRRKTDISVHDEDGQPSGW
jgi:hypothetical protein